MKLTLPAYDVPIMLPDGNMHPLWFEYFTKLTQIISPATVTPLNGQFLGYSNGKYVLMPATTPANGETILWDNTAKRWIAGAN